MLEVTVFDEDRDKKVEFLGKIAIPLLRVSIVSMQKLGQSKISALFS